MAQIMWDSSRPASIGRPIHHVGTGHVSRIVARLNTYRNYQVRITPKPEGPRRGFHLPKVSYGQNDPDVGEGRAFFTYSFVNSASRILPS